MSAELNSFQMKKKVQQYVSKYLMQMSNCNCMFLHISKKIIIGPRYQCYVFSYHPYGNEMFKTVKLDQDVM